MTKKGNLQQGAFHLEKGKKLEWLMAVILLSAAYVLSREGARLVAAQKAATKVVVLDSGHGGDDPGKIGANGVKEKDINLAIARLLKKKLEKQQRDQEQAAKAAAAKEYAARKGIVEEATREENAPLSGVSDRPFCKGRNYDPDRYAPKSMEE